MPYTVTKNKSGYRVSSPGSVHMKRGTKRNAEKQMRLLRAIKHNPNFQPRGRVAKRPTY